MRYAPLPGCYEGPSSTLAFYPVRLMLLHLWCGWRDLKSQRDLEKVSCTFSDGLNGARLKILVNGSEEDHWHHPRINIQIAILTVARVDGIRIPGDDEEKTRFIYNNYGLCCDLDHHCAACPS